jgi:tRNA_anti-like
MCLFVLALMLIGAADLDTALKIIDKEIAETRYPQRYSALNVYESYDHDPVRADSRFKNQIVVITGKIGKISRHPSNGLAIVSFAPPEKIPYSLNCYFSKNHERDAASLYAGLAAIHLIGKVAGSNSLEIIILGCRIHR